MKLLRALGTALILFLTGPMVTATAMAMDTSADDVQTFIDRMVEEHGFERDSLTAILASAERKQSILDAISRPAEKTLTWGEYRDIFLTKERIDAGAEFLRTHEDALNEIASETGVPVEILVGIIGVETYFGRITGNYRVLDALATLAFHYPPRSSFFTGELEEFLLLTRNEGLEASEPTGSYAGAMGRPQFMPSSYRAYAVDATGDGKRDIWNDWRDVAGSIANYFLAHKWRPGEDVVARATLAESFTGPVHAARLKPNATVGALTEEGVRFATELPEDSATRLIELDGHGGAEYWVGFHNFFVITRYNRSVMYALAVHQLGEAIAAEVVTNAAAAR